MTQNKVALITGITGQDGYYLSKLLLEKNYTVHGTVRRSSNINTERIDPLISEYSKDGSLELHYSDLLDSSSLSSLINLIKPDEVYNLAAQSHVGVSFKNPIFTTQVGTLGSLSLMEAIRHSDKKIKFYQASSSEMFGGKEKIMLNENSPLIPKSPYASSKVFAHHTSQIYRDSYDLFFVNGILFNHESPHRGETFVTRKITKAVGRISQGIQSKLTLGNLDASRDWGFAGDYVKGMYLMMQYDTPEDWVLATGETHTVKEFLDIAFKSVDLDWENYVETSEKYYRPNEVDYLLGDPTKAKTKLNWEPEVSFENLVKLMVDSDIEQAKREKILIENKLLKPTWED
jgi:GDPmannose 4,6-dehydratase|tara:strand:+ start:33444 stop:34478 length:1035 start_codon:yes stop_codon:yes gene_type:complete